VAQEGTPESVYGRPSDEWTARFLGFRNIIQANVIDGTALTSWGRLVVGDVADGPQTLVIPPDELSLDPAGSIHGKVATRTFRGGHYLLQIAINAGPTLDVEVSAPAPEAGTEVRLRPGHAVAL